MDRATFSQRAETFGLDTGHSWAESAFRLVFCVPRVYLPLVDAWESHFPGTHAALRNLSRDGWVAYQDAVVVDTRTGQLATQPGRRVPRYRTTAKGRRFLDEVATDDRVATDAFPRASQDNIAKVIRLLAVFDLDGSHAKWGLSAPHGTELAGMAERTGRWWIRKLVDSGHMRRLSDDVADVREVIPAHWRVTRKLCRQLVDVIDAFDGPVHWYSEFRLRRERFLDDIDPARLGISGATDFDHDVEAQRILAALLRSPRCATGGRLMVEPRWWLPLSRAEAPSSFAPDGPHVLFYQPDAELVERDDAGLRRSIVEYERYQSRRDGWNHIERYLGWLHTRTLPVEASVLRFIVDSPQRVRSYVELVEAFTDWCLDHPEHLPANQVTLSVCSAADVKNADDPLDPRVWHRIALPRGDGSGVPVVHDKRHSPYDEYFSG
jgi:hypothetical protein